LGIAAFAYYRRVVENRKNEIFDAVRAVASKLNASSEFLSSLEEAKKDHRFTESVSHIKPGLPQLLLVQGQNPLTLLHWALSQGIHNEPDDVCLELASSIREVLTELCERMETALKDEAGLKKAVSTLLKYQTPKMMPPGACQKSRCARPRRAPESLLTASFLRNLTVSAATIAGRNSQSPGVTNRERNQASSLPNVHPTAKIIRWSLGDSL
jgi:hypothetical protein